MPLSQGKLQTKMAKGVRRNVRAERKRAVGKMAALFHETRRQSQTLKPASRHGPELGEGGLGAGEEREKELVPSWADFPEGGSISVRNCGRIPNVASAVLSGLLALLPVPAPVQGASAISPVGPRAHSESMCKYLQLPNVPQ